MWYAKEPHDAFSKRHKRVLVVIRSSGKHDGLVTSWRKAAKAGSLRTIRVSIFRKDKHAHRHDSMETLHAHLSTAQQETLDLLEQFTDEQLATPVSASF